MSDLPVSGSNAEAADRMVGALRELGRLVEADEAQVQAVRSIAAALDANPGNAQLWRAYREFLDGLRVYDDDSGDESIDELLVRMQTQVGDSAEGGEGTGV